MDFICAQCLFENVLYAYSTPPQMKVNQRFIWATSVLDLAPDDYVFEIGCGAGLLVEQIADQHDTGRITAIDKSAAMIKIASKRNAKSISIGKAKLATLDFPDSIFKKSQFDKIADFNVNFFWKNPEHELEVIKEILRPTGGLYIFYQAPFDTSIKAADPIKERLLKHSFEIIDTVFKKMIPTSAFCIKARPEAH